MYDWTDDLVIQAVLSFPGLKYYIMQCQDMGDVDKMIEFLLALEFDGRKAV